MTQSNPTVSVVTISYNQSEFLERALNSVLSQQGVDVEYIVVDPGSTDGSREIIKKYQSQLKAVIFEKDAGPADGLNRGLALATGQYFFYLNSDDEVAPGAFAEAVSEFQKSPQTAIVYGNGFIIDQLHRKTRKVYSAKVATPVAYVTGASVFVQQATFFRTDAIRSVGGFNINNNSCWDGELVFDLLRNGYKAKRAWKFWGLFRIYGETITGSGRLADSIKRNHQRMRAQIFPKESGLAAKVLDRMVYFSSRIYDLEQIFDRLFITPLRK